MVSYSVKCIHSIFELNNRREIVILLVTVLTNFYVCQVLVWKKFTEHWNESELGKIVTEVEDRFNPNMSNSISFSSMLQKLFLLCRNSASAQVWSHWTILMMIFI